MTPLARRIFGRMRDAEGRNPSTVAFSNAAFFDVSSVAQLIQSTAVEINQRARGISLCEHGGLLFAPAPVFWIECQSDRGRFGWLIHAVDEEMGFMYIDDHSNQSQGFLVLNSDGEHFEVCQDARTASFAQDMYLEAGLALASALLIINAPRGIERTTILPHRGLQKDLRRAGFGELKPSTIISLMGAPPSMPSSSSAGTASHKAFHFCRSHIRRLPDGTQTRVRAHWRGDPALGICQNDYAVKGAPSAH